MARITAITRCTGGDHILMTLTAVRGSVTFSFDRSDLIDDTDDQDFEHRVRQRIKAMVRAAKLAGATTYAQIRTAILNVDFSE